MKCIETRCTKRQLDAFYTIFRHNRLHHARKMSVKESIEDVAKLQLCSGAPQTQKFLRKWLLPKRDKEPFYPELRDLLATPHLADIPEEEEEKDTDDEESTDVLVEKVDLHDYLFFSDDEFEDAMDQD